MGRTTPTVFEAEPPRQETGHFGEPVAEEQIGERFWEAYSDDIHPDKLFVAYYKWTDGEWVKQGMDRHRVSNLFNHDGWPTDD